MLVRGVSGAEGGALRAHGVPLEGDCKPWVSRRLGHVMDCTAGKLARWSHGSLKSWIAPATRADGGRLCTSWCRWPPPRTRLLGM